MMVPTLLSTVTPTSTSQLGGSSRGERIGVLKRSLSVPGEGDSDSEASTSGLNSAASSNSEIKSKFENNENTKPENGFSGSKVAIPKLDDDETFSKFFAKTRIQTTTTVIDEKVEVTDFDEVKVASEKLASFKKAIQGPKGRRAARNPLKTLAQRQDLQSEYTEIKTGVAEKELKRIKLEQIAKNTNLAVEALAGLASVEDFKAVSLKSSSLPLNQLWLPFKQLMLLHVKGRRHVQTRLVEPTYKNINRGDCFILVTPNKLFQFVGSFANVIEKSRAKDICAQVVRDKDLGCSATSTLMVTDGKFLDKNAREFWKLLGYEGSNALDLVSAGHPDEDELFEMSLLETNMVYELKDDKLIPVEEYWGQIPKISMLDARKVLVFNFGGEIYVWNGKNADNNEKRAAIKLAQEQFQAPYDYSMCDLSPLNYSIIAGDRLIARQQKSGKIRPDWCLLAKVTQHMETVLFREKFMDWPDITVEFKDDVQLGEDTFELIPPDGAALFKGEPYEEPNLVLENSNLGRGNFYYDVDSMRHFDILTESVKKWQVGEQEYSEANDADYCHFYSAESYTIRWIYRISITVRELSGKVSDRATVGRDRCAYLCWHGVDASANEKGAAALMTVELDKEKGSQLRVSQGDETCAFVRLFKVMFIHKGRSSESSYSKWRLYITGGNEIEETLLTEVSCNMRQLRSRTSMLLINGELGKIIVWHGAKSMKHTRDVARNAADLIKEKKYRQLFPTPITSVRSIEMEEGEETEQFFSAVEGTNRTLYNSLLTTNNNYDFTPRLFQFSSTSGQFEAVELHYNLRMKDRSTPYPFEQRILYKARQPTTFLIDNGHVLWLWFGWWPLEDAVSPKSGGSETSPSNENRSGVNRWQAERKAAMQTAVAYWQAKNSMNTKQTRKRISISSSESSSNSSLSSDEHDPDSRVADEVDISKVEATKNKSIPDINGFIVWAGLEPVEFKSIFPDWIDHDDIAEINIQVSYKMSQRR